MKNFLNAAANNMDAKEKTRDSEDPLRKTTRGHTSASLSPFSRSILNIGFSVGLIMAMICLLLSGWYLFRFQAGAGNLPTDKMGIFAHIYLTRVLLYSCGVFAGISFGFLGFALFLIGVKGEIDAEGESSNYKVKLARLSPGVFVILIAAILIGYCATRSLAAEFQDSIKEIPSTTSTAGAAPTGATVPTPTPPDNTRKIVTGNQ